MAGPQRAPQVAPQVPGIDQAELQGVYAMLAGLTTELAGKASSSDLAQFAGALADRVSSADLTALFARMATVEGAVGDAATKAALAAATARIVTLEGALASVPQFVDAATMTVEALLATYPAEASRRGKYVRVSNYGGFVDRVLRCDFDANLNYYYWNPTQAEYGRSIAVTANMTLRRLLSPQSVVLTGSIPVGTNRQVTIDTANGRPGEIIEIRAGLTQLLGTLNILGTGLGSGVALLTGGYQKYLIDGSGGALQLVRLV